MNRKVWTGVLAGVLAAGVLLSVAPGAYRAGQRDEVVTRVVGDGTVTDGGVVRVIDDGAVGPRPGARASSSSPCSASGWSCCSSAAAAAAARRRVVRARRPGVGLGTRGRGWRTGTGGPTRSASPIPGVDRLRPAEMGR